MSEDQEAPAQTTETSAPTAELTPQIISDAPVSTPSWKDGLSSEYKGHPSIKDIRDLDSMVKSYINAESMVGMEKIAIPKSNDSEAWKQVYDKLGRPTTPDAYSFDKIDVPEGVSLVDDPWTKELFHEVGLNQQQANVIRNKFIAREIERQNRVAEEQKVRVAKEYEEVQKALGAEFETVKTQANIAFNALGDDDFKKYIIETGQQNNPQMVKFLSRVGALLSEDKAVGDRAKSFGFVPGPEAAQAEIKSLKLDADFQKAYITRDHPGHKEAVERMTELFTRAYPGVQTD